MGYQLVKIISPILVLREGYSILVNSFTHPFTTTNIDYLEEYLTNKASGVLRMSTNQTHFTISDYFYHDVHDHFHDYLGSYDR